MTLKRDLKEALLPDVKVYRSMDFVSEEERTEYMKKHPAKHMIRLDCEDGSKEGGTTWKPEKQL